MDVRKLTSQAGTILNRFVQSVEETVTKDATQLDPEVVEAMNRSIQVTKAVESIIENTKALINPNPAARAEMWIRDVFQAHTDKPSNAQHMGQSLCELNRNMGTTDAMSTSLQLTGECLSHMGNAEQEYVKRIIMEFVTPMQRFLDCDCKEASEARNLLENSRLDYDASRRAVKQALTAASKQNSAPYDAKYDMAVDKARANEELRLRELENQMQVTKVVCEKLHLKFVNLAPLFKDFARSQWQYHEEAKLRTEELQRKLDQL